MGLMKAKGSVVEAKAVPESEDLSMLLLGLTSEDPDLRRMAARDLMAFPEGLPALGARLVVEDDRQVIDCLMNSMANSANREAVSLLLPCLRSADVFKRNQAIEVLKTLPDQVAPFIEDLLQDDDPDVRIFTVNVLESLRHPNVVNWLIDVIQNDPHVNVCATALDLLAEVGDESCLASLEEVVDRFPDEPYLQFTVGMAVERILEHRGNPA